jgi:hypothetical protein
LEFGLIDGFAVAKIRENWENHSSLASQATGGNVSRSGKALQPQTARQQGAGVTFAADCSKGRLGIVQTEDLELGHDFRGWQISSWLASWER